MTAEDLKRKAAEAALDLVRADMVVGLGTGSTAECFVEGLARKVSAGLKIQAVPTSNATERLARRLGIPLTSLDDHPRLDLAVDGADEVSPSLDLIKGMGGALFREKIVASNAEEFVVIVDESKLVVRLGEKTPVPVEVHPFALGPARMALQKLPCSIELRKLGSSPYTTDNGNLILLCKFQAIDNPALLESTINSIPGVIENGIFAKVAGMAIVSTERQVRYLKPPE